MKEKGMEKERKCKEDWGRAKALEREKDRDKVRRTEKILMRDR